MPVIFVISAPTFCVVFLLRKPVSLNRLHDRLYHSCLDPSDFPGGEGESKFTGRANTEDIQTSGSRQVLGLEPFGGTSESYVINEANKILF